MLHLISLSLSDYFLPSLQLSLLLVRDSDLRPNVLNFFCTCLNWKISNSCPILSLLIMYATTAPILWTFSSQGKWAINCIIQVKCGLSPLFSEWFEEFLRLKQKLWTTSQRHECWLAISITLKLFVRKRLLCSPGSKMRPEHINSFTELSGPISCPWCHQLWL